MLDWLFQKENSDDWYAEKNVRKVSIDEVPTRLREKIRRVKGQPLDLINDEINFCPHCGAKVQTAGAKFCVSCGKPLVDE